MLTETAAVAETRRYKVARAHPGPADLHQLNVMLARAQRPLLLLGGGGWDQGACINIAAFAEANRLPTAVAFRFRHIAARSSSASTASSKTCAPAVASA